MLGNDESSAIGLIRINPLSAKQSIVQKMRKRPFKLAIGKLRLSASQSTASVVASSPFALFHCTISRSAKYTAPYHSELVCCVLFLFRQGRTLTLEEGLSSPGIACAGPHQIEANQANLLGRFKVGNWRWESRAGPSNILKDGATIISPTASGRQSDSDRNRFRGSERRIAIEPSLVHRRQWSTSRAVHRSSSGLAGIRL